MAFSFNCFGVISLTVLLLFLLHSASATTNVFIDITCQSVADKAFCVQTLYAYPPAVSATSELQASTATLRLVILRAYKSARFAGKAAKKNRNMKKQFEKIQDAYVTITKSLNYAILYLYHSPPTADSYVTSCSNNTAIVKNLVAKNKDKASRTIMNMTLLMDKLLAIALGATIAVGG